MSGTPRFFAAERSLDPVWFGRPHEAIALLRTLLGEEIAVVTDSNGVLARVHPGARELLPSSIRAELLNQELVGRPWGVDAAELHLFSFVSIERGPDVAGLDDPVHLEGVLSGPYPSEAPEILRGRLSVTRFELLAAVVRAPPLAFHSARGFSSRWLALLLAGGTVEEARLGRGLVLAIPIAKAHLELGASGNEDLVEDVLVELMTAMRSDAGRDSAQRGTRAEDRGLLRSFLPRRRREPDESGLVSRLHAALELIDSLDGWPSPRVRALEARLVVDEGVWSPSSSLLLRPRGLSRMEQGKALTARRVGSKIPFDVSESVSRWRGNLHLELQGDCAFALESARGAALTPRLDQPTSRSSRRLEYVLQPADLGFDAAGSGLFSIHLGPGAVVRNVSIRPEIGRLVTPTRPLVAEARREDRPASVVPAPVSDAPVRAPPRPVRVFLLDPRYPTDWVHDAALIARTLEERGFTVLDASAAAEWVRTAGPGTVIIIPGTAPDTIADARSRECLARKYLDRGGRVVWIGETPFAARGKADGGYDPTWLPAHREILDVSAPGPASKRSAILTEEGVAWGMTSGDVCVRTQPIGDVTTVLSQSRDGFAVSWHRRYSDRFPWSGFVRFRGGVFRGSRPELVDDLHRIASYRLAESG
ncbi:MAG: hypothetical protein HYV07_05180 [Deltaproteobacteria bacterium]|nr:hypothetical protein [Deltaproteobacteria bacterium]